MSVSRLFLPNVNEIHSQVLSIDSATNTLTMTKKPTDTANIEYILPTNTHQAAVNSVLGLEYPDTDTLTLGWIGKGDPVAKLATIGLYVSDYTGMSPGTIAEANLNNQAIAKYTATPYPNNNKDDPGYIDNSGYLGVKITNSNNAKVTCPQDGKYIVEVRVTYQTGATAGTHCIQVRDEAANTVPYDNMVKYICTTNSNNSQSTVLFAWDKVSIPENTVLAVYYRLVGNQANSYITYGSIKLVYTGPM